MTQSSLVQGFYAFYAFTIYLITQWEGRRVKQPLLNTLIIGLRVDISVAAIYPILFGSKYMGSVFTVEFNFRIRMARINAL